MQGNIENLIASKFIARSDVKAIQHADGTYAPDRTPFTRADLEAHIAGSRTYGHYLLNTDSKCKFFCFDLDWRKPKPEAGYQPTYEDDLGIQRDYNPREAWLDGTHPNRSDMIVKMRTLSETLALRISREFYLGTAILYSGNKGFHVYGFLDKLTDAVDMRILAHEVLQSFGGAFERVKGDNFWRHVNPKQESGYRDIDIEVFPKQDDLGGKDLGNLLRLPLGLNRKSGLDSFFVNVNTGYGIIQRADPVEALTYLNPWNGSAPASVPTDA